MTDTKQQTTLAAAFIKACDTDANKDAIVFCEGREVMSRHSFGEFLSDTTRFAAGLVASGLRRGDHVAIWMPNCYEWMVVRFAVALAGMVLLPINTRLRNRDLAHILGASDIKALVINEKFKEVDFIAMLREAGVLSASGLNHGSRNAPHLELLISNSDRPSPGTVSFRDISNRGAPTGPVREEAGRLAAGSATGDVLNIIFTSGTTSLPKGAVIHNGPATLNMLRINQRWGLRPQDRFLVSAPLFTSAGLGRATACIAGGSTLVLQEGFEPAAFFGIASGEGVTATALSDTNVLDLMDYTRANGAGTPPLGIRVVLGLFKGGVPPKPDYLIDTLGVTMVLSHYGLSETSHMTSLCSPGDSREVCKTSVGKPLPGVEVTIVDSASETPCGPGSVGEIRVGGYVVTPGYYKRPDATSELFDAQGRLRTGDLGYLDEQGYLYFQSRSKDVVRTGGFNVASSEIEEWILAQPEVRDAAVVPVPDPRLDEVPCAFVEFNPGASLTLNALRARLQGQIASYKMPRYLIPVAEWPRTGSEKIQKPALVKLALETIERNPAAAGMQA